MSLVSATETATVTRHRVSVAVLIGVFAVAVSATGSWIPSLWGDEAASVLSAMRPIPSLMHMLGNVDAVHGLYYLFLHAWIDVFGASPFSVRFPSAIAAGVTAAGVAWLCGMYGGRRFMVLGGVLAAVLPRLTYAGAEARSYAMTAAIATAVAVILAEIAHRRPVPRGLWIAYAALVVVGIHLFLYMGLLILVAGAVLLMVPGLVRQWRSWLIASGAAVLVSAPFILLATSQHKQVAFLARRDVHSVDAIFVQTWFGSWPAAIICWLLVAVAVVGYVRDRRAGRTVGIEAIALPWLLLPVSVVVIASFAIPGFSPRYGTFAAPAAAVVVAAAIRRLAYGPVTRGSAVDTPPVGSTGGRSAVARRRIVGAVLIAAVLLSVAPTWVSQRGPHAKNQSDWNEIAALISEQALPGDAIVFDDGVRPSRRPRLAMNTNPDAFAAVRDVTVRTPYEQAEGWHDDVDTVAEAVRDGRFAGIERVWDVEYITRGTPDSWATGDLESAGFVAVQSFPGHRSVITLYERATD